MFLHPLFHRQNLVAELGELVQFLLNLLQALMPLAVSNLCLCRIPASHAVLPIQFLNIGNFDPEPADLVAENFEMIHGNRISHPGARPSPRARFASLSQ
jgi:hypothetical protein